MKFIIYWRFYFLGMKDFQWNFYPKIMEINLLRMIIFIIVCLLVFLKNGFVGPIDCFVVNTPLLYKN